MSSINNQSPVNAASVRPSTPSKMQSIQQSNSGEISTENITPLTSDVKLNQRVITQPPSNISTSSALKLKTLSKSIQSRLETKLETVKILINGMKNEIAELKQNFDQVVKTLSTTEEDQTKTMASEQNKINMAVAVNTKPIKSKITQAESNIKFLSDTIGEFKVDEKLQKEIKDLDAEVELLKKQVSTTVDRFQDQAKATVLSSIEESQTATQNDD